MSQRMCRVAALVFLLATTFFYPLLAPPVHRVDEAHRLLIKPGMTEAEVEAIFGVPPGDYDWATPDPSGPMWAFFDATGGKYGAVRYRLNDGRGVFLCPVPLFHDDQHVDPNSHCDLRIWASRHGVFCVVLDDGRVVVTYGLGAATLQPPWVRWWRVWTK